MIKVLMFDYNGVVGYWYQDILINNIAEVYGIDKEWIRQELTSESEDNIYDAYEIGKLTFKELHEIFCEKAGISLPSGKFLDVTINVYEDNKEVVSLLKSLKDNNSIKFALAQDAGDIEFDWQRRNLPSIELFDYFFFSSGMKVYKSNPLFFKKCIEQLGVEPSEILFFEDKQKNVDSAKKAGINSFLFTKLDELKKIIEKELRL